MTSLCLIAGEPSGDLHGSLLVGALRRRHPDWSIWGVGSQRMAQAGCELWRDARDWAAMGFVGVIRALPQFRRRLNATAAEIASRSPDAVVLIDYPGFNLRLARRVHAMGIPVIYYIVPQVWAWAPGRIAVFRRHVDHTIVVFDFEKTFFEERGVPTHWIGHPFVDTVHASASREELRRRLGVADNDKLVALLPGARAEDFETHLPLFAQAVRLLGEQITGVRWALGLAEHLAHRVDDLRARFQPLPVTTAVYDLIAAADVVLTKSGTATVECAILGTPMVCVYRTGAINYQIARRLVKVPWIAMPNLIAGRLVVPELIQYRATPETLAEAMRAILADPAVAQRQRDGLNEVRTRLGPPGAVERAADLIGQWMAPPNPRGS